MAGSGGIGGGSFWCKLERTTGPKQGRKKGFSDTTAKKEVVVRVRGRKKPFRFKIHPGRREVFVRIRWR